MVLSNVAKRESIIDEISSDCVHYVKPRVESCGVECANIFGGPLARQFGRNVSPPRHTQTTLDIVHPLVDPERPSYPRH